MGSYHNGASYLREILFDTVFLREIFIATVFLWHTLDLNLALFYLLFSSHHPLPGPCPGAFLSVSVLVPAFVDCSSCQ